MMKSCDAGKRAPGFGDRGRLQVAEEAETATSLSSLATPVWKLSRCVSVLCLP